MGDDGCAIVVVFLLGRFYNFETNRPISRIHKRGVMSEGSNHAAILIATSYQALNRAVKSDNTTLITDCTVLILFAGFYVEATLNHIFEFIDKDIRVFPLNKNSINGKSYPGMQDKLAWFYNEFIEEPKANNWSEIRSKNINAKLTERLIIK